MRMSLHTDYALRMLIFLAVRGTRTSTVNDVAEAYGIPRNHLLKVALDLRNLGLVSTARGRSGGVRLARLPGEINVGSLVRQLGNGFPVVECMKAGGGDCALSPVCRLKGIVREALGAYLDVFDRYTLADLVADRGPLLALLDAAGADREACGQAA